MARIALQLVVPLFFAVLAVSLWSMSRAILDEHTQLIGRSNNRDQYSAVFVAGALVFLFISVLSAFVLSYAWHPFACPRSIGRTPTTAFAAATTGARASLLVPNAARMQRLHDRPPYSDEQLTHFARQCGFAAWPAALLRSIWIFSIGTLLGAIFSSATEPLTHLSQPARGAFLLGGSLWLFWVVIEAATLAASHRIERFDRRVANAIRLHRSARRAIPASVCIFGLASLTIALVGVARSTGSRSVIVFYTITGVALIVLAWVILSRFMMKTLRPDWALSQLCRECGYDPGKDAPVCPECGEVSTHG